MYKPEIQTNAQKNKKAVVESFEFIYLIIFAFILEEIFVYMKVRTRAKSRSQIIFHLCFWKNFSNK
jgi:hypothetical protein